MFNDSLELLREKEEEDHIGAFLEVFWCIIVHESRETRSAKFWYDC